MGITEGAEKGAKYRRKFRCDNVMSCRLRRWGTGEARGRYAVKPLILVMRNAAGAAMGGG
jgi:hypothetical protein